MTLQMSGSHRTEDLDDLRAMWKAVVAMYLFGGATLFAILPVPEPEPSDHVELATIGAVLTLIGLAYWRMGPRRAPLIFTAICGTLVVSVIVAVSRPVGATPFFYLWPVLVAGYYLRPRQLAVALVLFYVGFAGGLALSAETHTKMVLFVGGAASFTLAAVVVNRLRARLDELVDELRSTADRDPLTGLLNRRGFERAFDRDLERARRQALPLALVIFDLDHFKQVNDRFGHAVGDDALRTVANVLLDQGRGGDAVARTGGEEFAAVLLDADLDGALAYARRVAADARLTDSPAGTLGLSAGIVAHGDGLLTREDLMLAGDRLLYAAKAAGRGRAAVEGEPARMERLETAEPLPV
jgi:diguanylate cyclase (GGDEF)-like protein